MLEQNTFNKQDKDIEVKITLFKDGGIGIYSTHQDGMKAFTKLLTDLAFHMYFSQKKAEKKKKSKKKK